MKPSSSLLIALFLEISHVAGNNVRRKDIKGVPVVELDKDQVITADTSSIPYDAIDEDGFHVTSNMACPPASGKKFTVSTDKKFVACCLPGENLAGSSDTEFRCCPGKHYLAHSEESNTFQCCPEGEAFDGTVCHAKDPPVEMCKNGKKMVDGTCVCPEGTIEENDGCKSEEPHKDDPEKRDDDEVKPCTSDVDYGKCYQIVMSGRLFGAAANTEYRAFDANADYMPGRFKFCKDEECKSAGPINPGDGFYIKDIHGLRRTGARSNEWLNNAQNGNHMFKTPLFNTAGHFTVTKWPCGKYCLGGFDQGLGPACPTVTTTLSFYPQDKEACMPVTLQEIPCSNSAVTNNCLWKDRDQCCSDPKGCKDGFLLPQ